METEDLKLLTKNSNYYMDDLKYYKYMEIPILRGFDDNFKVFSDFLKNFGAYICGGYASYCVNPFINNTNKNWFPSKRIDKRRPSDIDIYFPSLFMFNKCIEILKNSRNIFEKICLRNSINITESKHSVNVYIENNIENYELRNKTSQNFDVDICDYSDLNFNEALTKMNSKLFNPSILNIQFIKTNMYRDNLIKIIKDFDFINCSVGIDLASNKAYCHEKYLTAEYLNTIFYNNVPKNPILAMDRITKYLKKGYIINIYEIMKLFMEWNNMDQKVSKEFIKLFKKYETNELMTNIDQDEYSEFMETFVKITKDNFGEINIPYNIKY